MRLLVPVGFVTLSLACCCPLWGSVEEALGPTAAPSAPVEATPTPAPEPARPKPAEDPTMTAAQRAEWTKAMEDARVLHRKGQYTKAIARFDAALALFPDDPRALNERGWAELFAGKMDAAEADTRKAIERTTDSNLLGSSWYNLGRIHEEQGKVNEAIEAYTRSLAVRQNTTVRDRLAALSPEAVAAVEPAALQPMEGPFTELAAWCTRRRANKGDAEEVLCDPDSPDLGDYTGEATVAVVDPYQYVRVIGVGNAMVEGAPFGSGEVGYSIAVRLADGWYISEPVVSSYNPGAFGIFESIDQAKLEVKEVVGGGAPELVYRYRHSRVDSDMGLSEVQEDSGSYVVVCRVEPKPGCVGPFQTAGKAERSVIGDPEPGVEHETFSKAWTLSEAFTPDGKLSLQPLTGTPPAGAVGIFAI